MHTRAILCRARDINIIKNYEKKKKNTSQFEYYITKLKTFGSECSYEFVKWKGSQSASAALFIF